MANQDKETPDYQTTWGSTPAYKAEMAEKLKVNDENEGVLVDSIRAEGLEVPKKDSSKPSTPSNAAGTPGAK